MPVAKIEKRVRYILTWEGVAGHDSHVKNIVDQIPTDQLVVHTFDGEGWFSPTADGAASYSWLMNNAIVWEEERVVYEPEDWVVIGPKSTMESLYETALDAMAKHY